MAEAPEPRGAEPAGEPEPKVEAGRSSPEEGSQQSSEPSPESGGEEEEESSDPGEEEDTDENLAGEGQPGQPSQFILGLQAFFRSRGLELAVGGLAGLGLGQGLPWRRAYPLQLSQYRPEGPGLWPAARP